MSAGGKRAGAGRKPRSTPLVPLSMRIEQEVADAWEARKAALDLSGPATLAKLLAVRKPKKPRKSKGQNA